jgi:hypothetical protein
MAYIILNDISGCTSPITGNTNSNMNFDIKYNMDKILSYYKKNINSNIDNNFTIQPIVVIIFNNYTQKFIFDTLENRDLFYESLPD